MYSIERLTIKTKFRQHEQLLVAGSTVFVVPCGMREASVVNRLAIND